MLSGQGVSSLFVNNVHDFARLIAPSLLPVLNGLVIDTDRPCAYDRTVRSLTPKLPHDRTVTVKFPLPWLTSRRPFFSQGRFGMPAVAIPALRDGGHHKKPRYGAAYSFGSAIATSVITL